MNFTLICLYSFWSILSLSLPYFWFFAAMEKRALSILRIRFAIFRLRLSHLYNKLGHFISLAAYQSMMIHHVTFAFAFSTQYKDTKDATTQTHFSLRRKRVARKKKEDEKDGQVNRTFYFIGMSHFYLMHFMEKVFNVQTTGFSVAKLLNDNRTIERVKEAARIPIL